MKFDPGSFRDRRGRVCLVNGSVYRVLDSQAASDWRRLEASKLYQTNVAAGRLVETQSVPLTEAPQELDLSGWDSLVRHARVKVISYPYEWTFGMLRDAALLQLDLLLEGLGQGFILRDSTPYNVQWNGVKPIFIDIPSFAELDPGSPWLGYRQFCQMFLNPLLLQSYFRVPFQPWLRGSLDGIDPEVFRGLFHLKDVFKPGVLAHVMLQSSLESSEGRTSKQLQKEMREAGLQAEIVRSMVTRLRKLISGLRWSPKGSRWSKYTECRGYEESDLLAKDAFVERACQRRPITTCWDVGSNDGRFSLIAARHSEFVLALDSDQLVLERLYQKLKDAGETKILPLLHNMVDPSPGLGWKNQERLPLLHRSKPDLVLLLAVIHHLVIGANVPMEELLRSWADLQCPLVVEFVTREDPMVQALLSSRDDEFLDYDLGRFEQWVGEHFRVVERQVLQSGTRVLFELEPPATG